MTFLSFWLHQLVSILSFNFVKHYVCFQEDDDRERFVRFMWELSSERATTKAENKGWKFMGEIML
jgi:hypothetical protein